jgi:hypothetical protein
MAWVASSGTLVQSYPRRQRVSRILNYLLQQLDRQAAQHGGSHSAVAPLLLHTGRLLLQRQTPPLHRRCGWAGLLSSPSVALGSRRARPCGVPALRCLHRLLFAVPCHQQQRAHRGLEGSRRPQPCGAPALRCLRLLALAVPRHQQQRARRGLEGGVEGCVRLQAPRLAAARGPEQPARWRGGGGGGSKPGAATP